MAAPEKHYAHYLSLHQHKNLDLACTLLVQAYGWNCYLVGSCLTTPNFRDVDVRCILVDLDFDTMFRFRSVDEINPRLHKKMIELGISTWLKQQTGLEIDFQFQRMTDANTKFPKTGGRNPIGIKFSVAEPREDVEGAT